MKFINRLLERQDSIFGTERVFPVLWTVIASLLDEVGKVTIADLETIDPKHHRLPHLGHGRDPNHSGFALLIANWCRVELEIFRAGDAFDTGDAVNRYFPAINTL